MRFRTAVALFLVVISTLVYIFQPSFLNSCLHCVGPLVFHAVLLGSSILLLWSTLPQKKVDPSGKAVFITGCDSGFGNELARRLDALGYMVFAGCLAPDREGATALKSSCSDRLKIVPVDVTDDFQVQRAVDFVKENIGDNELWAIVNNAGVSAYCEIEWCSVQVFQNLMDVNVFGTVRVTKGFLPLLRQSEGRVVNVASLAGRFTLPAFAAYSMSKKAVIAFSDGLRQEMKKFNITVCTIEPGLYKTPISTESHVLNLSKSQWANTPTAIKDDYGEAYFDAFLQAASKSLSQSRANVVEVIDNMVEAVTFKKPKLRYVPYWKFQLRAFVISILPVNLSDKIFALRTPKSQPESVKNRSPKTPKSATPK